MARFFCVFRVVKLRYLRYASTQRQGELRRLGNQLQVLGKANSVCEVGNISLQPGTTMILKLCTVFRNARSSFILIVPCTRRG